MLDNEEKAILITDESLKKFIINKLYSKLNLFKYKYQIISNYNENIINNIKKNIFHIILNNFGHKYFAMFLTYQNIKYCFYIEKKKLKYNEFDLNNNYSNILIYSVKHCVLPTYYKFSLFDGSIIINKNNKKIFIVNDFYYLGDKSYIQMPIKKKLEFLKLDLLTNYKYNSDFECCSIRVTDIYNKSDLKKLISTTIPSCDYLCNGINYIPNISGLRYIYIFEKSEMPVHILYNISKFKRISKEVTKKNKYKNNVSCDSVEDNNKTNDTFMNTYNKNTLYNIKNIKTHKDTVNFMVEKTDYPDVYKLFLLNNNDTYEYINIAYVPTILHSMNLVNIFKNNEEKTIILKSLYATEFKKWIPIEKSATIDSYNKIQLFN